MEKLIASLHRLDCKKLNGLPFLHLQIIKKIECYPNVSSEKNL